MCYLLPHKQKQRWRLEAISMCARRSALCVAAGVSIVCCLTHVSAAGTFVNFETAPVHPLTLAPGGNLLAVCHLPDSRVELFDVSAGIPAPLGNVPVGIDPVSLRFRTTNELWVVNHISSSVNIVDVANRRVVATLDTKAGPADVAFAGSPQRAFVSCARANTVQVFDPISRQVVTNLAIDGDRPKAMAISPDGTRVYVAIFESGNASTILASAGSGGDDAGTASILANPSGPYGGQTPVPNDGLNLRPPLYMNPTVDPAFYTNDQPTSIIV